MKNIHLRGSGFEVFRSEINGITYIKNIEKTGSMGLLTYLRVFMQLKPLCFYIFILHEPQKQDIFGCKK